MRRSRSMGRRWARGFTLIEITVSVALMALILAAAYACLSAGFSAQRLLEPRLEAVQTARVALALLTADLRGACPLAREADLVGLDRTVGEVEADNIDFATLHHTPGRPGEGDYCQTSYYLEPDRDTGSLVLWRRRNARIGLDPFSGGTREEIAQRVRQLKFEYYDGFEWYDTWGDPEGRRQAGSNRLQPNASGMPEAVRITLAIDAGGRAVRTGDDVVGGGMRPEPPLVFRTVARIAVPTATAAAGTGGGSGGDAIMPSPAPAAGTVPGGGG